MVRSLVFLIALLILSLNGSAQFDPGQPNRGYGPLDVDKPLKDIQSFLTKADAAALWNRNVQGGLNGFITSYWMVNLQKAGLNTYFGLAVERCEVLCNMEFNEETEEAYEDVFTFTFFLKKPQNEKQYNYLTNQLFSQYGEANPYVHPETGDVVRMDWFSATTLLVVSFGIDSETGKETEYYVADYVQAN